MKVVSQLDAVVDWDLEANHGFVEVLRDAELCLLVCRVNHQEVQIGLEHVVLDVELLKHLEELLETEPTLTVALRLESDAPHDHPAHHDVDFLLDLLDRARLAHVRLALLLARVEVLRLHVVVASLEQLVHCHLLKSQYQLLVGAWNHLVLYREGLEFLIIDGLRRFKFFYFFILWNIYGYRFSYRHGASSAFLNRKCHSSHPFNYALTRVP